MKNLSFQPESPSQVLAQAHKPNSGLRAVGPVALFVAVYFQSTSDAKLCWRYSKHAPYIRFASSGLRPRELENKRCFRPTGTTPQGTFTTDCTNWPFTVCFKMPHSFLNPVFYYFHSADVAWSLLTVQTIHFKHFSRFKVQVFKVEFYWF